MPLPGFVTTDGGAPATRFKAPVLSGTLIDTTAGGPIPPAGGIICIQSTAAILNQVVTTSATGLSHASFVYIPVTTGSLTGAAAPPYAGAGTAIVWNDNSQRLMVWSSGAAQWLSASSSGVFTSSF